MKDLKLIFIVDENWNIGINGDMLYKTRIDLDHFKTITEGQVLLMGRKTLEALPGKKGLKNRINIVLSRNQDYQAENIKLVNTLDQMEEEIKKYPDKKIFLIGGQNLVDQLFPYCTYAYITKINYKFENFDTSIPNLDQMDNWQVVKASQPIADQNYTLTFLEYKKIS
ncbi:MAG: dihydrofolate reductase [Bacillota bacterium]|nr:dihydrofolate reductase [Bacillota bacterium]